MTDPDYVRAYRKQLSDFIQRHGREAAMEWVVGGQYLQIGILESSLLRTLGLRSTDTVVDVGCGSGRLAYALRSFLTGRFVGTDILEEVLAYARARVLRTDWEFILTTDTMIPVMGRVADFVTFFSVFTHLLDEDIYRFLFEAKRVAKAGAPIVFSYLDYDVESHWTVFEQTMADRNPDRVLNMFMSKSAIRRWARELELEIVRLYDGDEKWIHLTENFTYIDGRGASGVVEFGHSVAVLRSRQ
jgi:ubiquinone/menaquinone biosynthesis C-methylase UbiE